MIPGNNFTPTPIISTFQPPYDEPYTALSQNVLGGIALNNSSQGRQYRTWNVTYTGGNIEVRPVGNSIAFTLPAVDVQTVSLAFDNNMGVVIAWKTTGGANLYYYDTLTSQYITRFFSGVLSCRVCVDDARDFYTANSDVIFGYTLGADLYYRQQRDRYDTQYNIGPSVKRLIRMAPNVGNRLQFELR